MVSMLVQSYVDSVPLWAWIVVVGVVAAVVLYFTYPVLAPIWAVTPRWVKASLGVLAALGAAFVGGRYAGAKNEKELQRERDARADDKGRRVRDEVDKMPAADRRRELSRWMRNDE